MEYHKLLSNNNFIKMDGTKLYNVFINDKTLIIQGKTKDGNNFIIDNSPNIIKQSLNLDNDVDKTELIWLHGNGPSQHFILYKLADSFNDSDILKIDNFVKSKLPDKSNKTLPLDCSLLSNVKKTNILGMVIIKNDKLSNLLK